MRKSKLITGMDVDEDELASALRRLADGVETHEVPITGAYTSQDITDGADDHVEFRIDLRYLASHEYSDVADIVAYATEAYLRFDPEYVGPVIRGEKNATMRHGLDRELSPGQSVSLRDEDGDQFGTAEVAWVADMSVEDASNVDLDWGHEGDYAGSKAEFLSSRMRELYDDDTIAPDTYVTVVVFGSVEREDDYPTEQYL